MEEVLLIGLMLFFVPGEITLSYILFLAILIGLIAAVIITLKSLPCAKKTWIGLFVFEAGSLIWANIASQWGISWEAAWEQINLILARIGVGIYSALLMISVLVFLLMRRKVCKAGREGT